LEEKKKDDIELSADIVGSETRKVKGEKSFTVTLYFLVISFDNLLNVLDK